MNEITYKEMFGHVVCGVLIYYTIKFIENTDFEIFGWQLLIGLILGVLSQVLSKTYDIGARICKCLFIGFIWYVAWTTYGNALAGIFYMIFLGAVLAQAFRRCFLDKSVEAKKEACMKENKEDNL